MVLSFMNEIDDTVDDANRQDRLFIQVDDPVVIREVIALEKQSYPVHF